MIYDEEVFKWILIVSLGLFSVCALGMFNLTIKMAKSSYHLTRKYREQANSAETVNYLWKGTEMPKEIMEKIVYEIIIKEMDIGILQGSDAIPIGDVISQKEK